jgi:hypothetical protein
VALMLEHDWETHLLMGSTGGSTAQLVALL